jgi:hypothetical protein
VRGRSVRGGRADTSSVRPPPRIRTPRAAKTDGKGAAVNEESRSAGGRVRASATPTGGRPRGRPEGRGRAAQPRGAPGPSCGREWLSR